MACVMTGFALVGASPQAAKADVIIPAVSVTGTGTFSNSPSLIIDGFLPPRGTAFNAPTSVFSTIGAPQFTIDLGAVFRVTSLIADVDNNDDYVVQYSTNNVSFTNLFTFLASDGPVPVSPGGMDILTTNPSFPSMVNYPTDTTTPEYVGRSFAPVDARYLKIFGSGGDGLYGIGELQAFSAAVPEPASLVMGCLAVASLGLVACARHRLRRRASVSSCPLP
jgi:hypothetical protein